MALAKHKQPLCWCAFPLVPRPTLKAVPESVMVLITVFPQEKHALVVEKVVLVEATHFFGGADRLVEIVVSGARNTFASVGVEISA